MGNDFFNDHPMLGSMFEFDRDGSFDFGEAAFMGALGAAIIDEERSSRKAERESRFWDDDDDWESDSEDNDL